MLIQDGSLKAHFEDGYIIDEEKQKDVATLIQEKNSLGEIIFLIDNPHIHGRLIRLICRIGNGNEEINWSLLPLNAKPIRIRKRSNSIDNKITSNLVSVEFGYEYINNVGKLIRTSKIFNQNKEIR